jgi:hypothetical protein
VTATHPFSRPLRVADVPAEGTRVHIVAEPEERAQLARGFGLLAIDRLDADLELFPRGQGGLAVRGTVGADVVQTCVVSLEPFAAVIAEPVEADFAVASDLGEGAAGEGADVPLPDEVVNGMVDLGALSAEFLALGLDPYPRKPGVVFVPPADPDESASPFAALRRRPSDGGSEP